MKHSVKLACVLALALGACADSGVGESGGLEGNLVENPTGQAPLDPMGMAGSGGLAGSGGGFSGMGGDGFAGMSGGTGGTGSTPPATVDAGVPNTQTDAGMSTPPAVVDASVPMTDAGTDAATPDASVPPPLFPPPSTPAERIASPDNPAECPAEAPADPWGPCAGLPVYVQCNYGTYHCICDWIHWICVG